MTNQLGFYKSGEKNESSIDQTHSYSKSEEQKLLEELASDEYGYDLRNWKEAGITEDEIKKRYAVCDRENDYPIVSASRYFTWVMPKLKTEFNTPVEKIVEIIMQSREKNWKQLKQYVAEDVKTGLKRHLQNNKRKDDRIMNYVKRQYEEYIRYCKHLNELPVSKEDFWNLAKKEFKKSTSKNGF